MRKKIVIDLFDAALPQNAISGLAAYKKQTSFGQCGTEKMSLKFHLPKLGKEEEVGVNLRRNTLWISRFLTPQKREEEEKDGNREEEIKKEKRKGCFHRMMKRDCEG